MAKGNPKRENYRVVQNHVPIWLTVKDGGGVESCMMTHFDRNSCFLKQIGNCPTGNLWHLKIWKYPIGNTDWKYRNFKIAQNASERCQTIN